MPAPAPPRSLSWRRMWGATWRMLVVVLVGAAAFIIVMGSGLQGIPLDSPDAPAISARMLIDLVLGVLTFVLFALRSRQPVVVPLAVIVLSAFSSLAAGAAAALLVFVAARRRPAQIATAAALYIIVGSVDITVHPFADETPLWQTVLFATAVSGLLVLTGLLVSARRQLAQSQRERVTAAEAAHRAQIEQGRISERGRIAREMHDVLGHRLSLMAVHAGALEYRTDLSREQTARAAAVLRANSKLALDELRAVLGVLRDDGQPDSNAPQPTASDLPALIDEARAAGADIRVESLAIDGVPGGTGRQVYRIVQELLTNARRHAPGHAVSLRLTRGSDSLRVDVSNTRISSTPIRGGHGLTGIAERVRLAGGTMTIDDSPHDFRVEVVLPWAR